MPPNSTMALILGREFLETHEWVQENLMLFKDGDRGGDVVGVCALGALCCGLGYVDELRAIADPKYQAATGYLNRAAVNLSDGQAGSVPEFNDFYAEEREDVLVLFSEAIRLSQADDIDEG
jgi:hypothetical protein